MNDNNPMELPFGTPLVGGGMFEEAREPTKPRRPRGWGDRMRTPTDLFARLNARFGPFTLDACASPQNALTNRYYTEVDSVLDHLIPSGVVGFWNPPYRAPGEFVKAALVASRAGGRHVMLLPVSVSTVWWRKTIWPYAAEVWFLPGRVAYRDEDGHHMGPARFDSAVVVFRPFRWWEVAIRWVGHAVRDGRRPAIRYLE